MMTMDPARLKMPAVAPIGTNANVLRFQTARRRPDPPGGGVVPCQGDGRQAGGLARVMVETCAGYVGVMRARTFRRCAGSPARCRGTRGKNADKALNVAAHRIRQPSLTKVVADRGGRIVDRGASPSSTIGSWAPRTRFLCMAVGRAVSDHRVGISLDVEPTVVGKCGFGLHPRSLQLVVFWSPSPVHPAG
jgi:hypothetical protein